MPNKNIKLSPKYGLNPCVPVCFFCQKEKNELLLLGHIGNKRKHEDIQAPSHMVFDYEPCENCKTIMSQGITMIAVSKKALVENQPEIQKGLYPTGSWCLVSDEFIIRNITDETMCKNILEKRKLFAEHDMVESIINQANALSKNHEE